MINGLNSIIEPKLIYKYIAITWHIWVSHIKYFLNLYDHRNKYIFGNLLYNMILISVVILGAIKKKNTYITQ